MNITDRIVAYFSPTAGLRRAHARKVLSRYDAAEPSRLRRFHHQRGNQNQIYQMQGQALIAQVRNLMRNHDLAKGALRTLVNNVAGPNGIGIEPQPRTMDGEIHADMAKALRALWEDWIRQPDVTGQHSFARLSRSVCRSWLRDGECFGQMLIGSVPQLRHNTRVPLSLEMFEAEFVPHDYDDPSRMIAQGIQRNAWGRPLFLHAYKSDPWSTQNPRTLEKRVIPFERVLHIATRDHLNQMRGVSEFAAVITRLEDIKDYEESERVAAKVAAMLTAYVKKGTPELYDAAEASEEPRELDFSPGMIMDDLLPGEEVGVIDSKRPNAQLVAFRQGQLRAIAAGIGGSYSSISKDYGGTYSSQRQELVEQWVHYACLSDDFVSMFTAPVYREFVRMALLSGELRVDADLDPATLDDALYVAQAMPWIDPMKEALGNEALVKAGFASEVEVIRKRGGKPRDVLEQIATWRDECRDRGIVTSTMSESFQAAYLEAIGDNLAEDDGNDGGDDE
jgi:lambda family phage portal protein